MRTLVQRQTPSGLSRPYSRPAHHEHLRHLTHLKDTQDGGETAKVRAPQVFVNAATTGLFSDEKLTKKAKDLPANTRSIYTPAGYAKAMMGAVPMVGGALSAGGIEMEIVDGRDTGKRGFVDPNKFKPET